MDGTNVTELAASPGTSLERLEIDDHGDMRTFAPHERPVGRVQPPPADLTERIHPALCRESASWAWDRHRAALHAANTANG